MARQGPRRTKRIRTSATVQTPRPATDGGGSTDGSTSSASSSNTTPPEAAAKSTRARPGTSTNSIVLRRNEKAQAKESTERYHVIPHEVRPDYSYPTPSLSWAAELKHDMERIEAAARFPNPGFEEELARLKLIAVGPTQVQVRLSLEEELKVRKSGMTPQKSLEVAHTEEELDMLLQRDFDIPIYIPAASQAGKQIRGEPQHDLHDLDGFWRLIPEGSTFNCQIQSGGEIETVRLTKEDARRRFESATEMVNVLELGIPSYSMQLKPDSIRRNDLLESLTRQEPGSTERHSVIGGKNLRHFMLLSSARTCSSTHVDAGGLATWLTCLHGSKWWYWGAGLTNLSDDDRALLSDLDSRHDLHLLRRPWARMQLKAGDTLIMPPGMEHAVHTPEDSLFVGGFATTSSHIHSSLRVMAVLRNFEHLTNDDPPLQMFDYLTAYYRQHLLSDLHTDVRRLLRFRLALHEFVQSSHSMDERDDREAASRRKKDKDRKKKKGNIKKNDNSKKRKKNTHDDRQRATARMRTRKGNDGLHDIEDEDIPTDIPDDDGEPTEEEVAWSMAWKDFVDTVEKQRWVETLDQMIETIRQRPIDG